MKNFDFISVANSFEESAELKERGGTWCLAVSRALQQISGCKPHQNSPGEHLAQQTLTGEIGEQQPELREDRWLAR